MRIVIVGPGALGSVIGATLARGGHHVALLGRPSPHLEAIQSQGLRLQRNDGGTELVPLFATTDPAIVTDADAIIVLVKTVDTISALRGIAPYVRPGQNVLTLQNGLGNVQRIRSAIGPAPHILAGATSQGATRLGPGLVKHAGEGPTLLGAIEEGDSAAAKQLASAFSAAGLPTAAVPDIERWVWHKAAVNAAINGLTALGGCRNGLIAQDPDLLDAAEIIAEEAAGVARASGFELGGMRSAIAATATATADNRSSMLQDIESGRQTEVDAIQGAIVAAGQEVGIATPATQVLAALIRARERSGRRDESIDG